MPAVGEQEKVSVKHVLRELATSQAPLARRKARLTLLPAVVQTTHPSAPATQTAAKPTPPVPAWTSTCNNTMSVTVLVVQVVRVWGKG